jgi:hypothetical protein
MKSTINESNENIAIGKRTEIIEQKIKSRELFIKTITIISSILGGAWALWLYFDKKQQDIDARRQEYELAIYKEQKETLYPLCKVAAEIVSSDSLKEAQQAIKHFEVLYYSEVGIIADDSTARAAQSFAEALADYKLSLGNEGPPSDLIQLLSDLTSKCKETLKLNNVYKKPAAISDKN